MVRLLATTAIVGSLALAACGGDEGDAPKAPPDSSTGAKATTEAAGSQERHRSKEAGSSGDRPAGVTIRAGDSPFGPVLFDDANQAVYLFENESSDEPECYGACADAWPPVLIQGKPMAGRGADRKLLGTTRRSDGSTQVTYDGHPLYYYVDDPPGKVLCNNVEEFGGLWLAVEPSGAAAVNPRRAVRST
jgi:predicted lipoprotein with Yx(FWY)xxD motif